MRVAVAEDVVLLREGIARVLRDGGFDVVATVGDADVPIIQKWLLQENKLQETQ